MRVVLRNQTVTSNCNTPVQMEGVTVSHGASPGTWVFFFQNAVQNAFPIISVESRSSSFTLPVLISQHPSLRTRLSISVGLSFLKRFCIVMIPYRRRVALPPLRPRPAGSSPHQKPAAGERAETNCRFVGL